MESGKNPSAELRKVLDVLAALGLALEFVPQPSLSAQEEDPFAGLFEDGS